ncbi:MAG: hypothetical protein AMXMBFR82_11350 [Candidatus Hydrogenedentota bacterium]
MQVNTDPAYVTAGYRTFAMVPISTFSDDFELRNEIVERQLLSLVGSLCQLRGYRWADTGQEPDLLVTLDASNPYRERYVPPSTISIPYHIPGETLTTRTYDSYRSSWSGTVDAYARSSTGNYAWGYGTYSGSGYFGGSSVTTTQTPGTWATYSFTTPGYYTGEYYPAATITVFDAQTKQAMWSASGIGCSNNSDVRVATQQLFWRMLGDLPTCSYSSEHYPMLPNVQELGVRILLYTSDGNTIVPFVAQVQEGSAAEKAGIANSDLIVEVNGQSTLNLPVEAFLALFPNNPGQTFSFTVYRDGQTRSIQLESVGQPVIAALSHEQEFRKYLALADEGDHHAQLVAGICEIFGIGTAVDIDGGGARIRKAAQDGSTEAKLTLACALPTLLGSDYPERRAWLEDVAKNGDARAEALLALYLLASDLKTTSEFARRAANKGDLIGNVTLGHVYFYHGDDSEEDLRAARGHYVQALKSAIEILGQRVGPNFESAVEPSFSQIPEYLRDESYFRLQEHLIAVAYSRLSETDTRLGHPQMEGRETLDLFERGAELDFPPALLYLSRIYETGKLVSRDPQRAFDLCNRAVDLNSDRWGGWALNDLGHLFEKGIGVQSNLDLAVNYYRRSANLGWDRGAYNLGRCYADGVGIERNEEEAIRYFRQAATQGEPDAIRELEQRGLVDKKT